MMGRLNHDQAQLFYSFHLDEAVPHDHPIRKIAAVLDLSWVRSELAPFYPEMGRPSRSVRVSGTPTWRAPHAYSAPSTSTAVYQTRQVATNYRP